MKNWQKIKLSEKLKKTQAERGKIRGLIREFFKVRGFLEMQTPILVAAAGQEPYLCPFKVSFSDDKNKKYEGFLITSPEYSLKKLLAAGYDKIFELARVFRQNESFGGIHNPEFTMLEWYRTLADYKDMMQDTQALVHFLTKKVRHSDYLEYGGQRINVRPPWPRYTVKYLFQKYAKINLDKAQSLKDFRRQAGEKYSKFTDWNDIFYLVFLNEIEPNLPKDRPAIVYDYPLPQASLSRRKSKNSFYAERFEVFAGGMELANAFSELLDAKEQLARFKEEQNLRKKLGKDNILIDKDLISALTYKIAPTGGIALGVERLEMLLLDIADINDLLPFPASQLFN